MIIHSQKYNKNNKSLVDLFKIDIFFIYRKCDKMLFEYIKSICDFLINAKNGHDYDICQHKDNVSEICCCDNCPLLKEDDDDEIR